MLDSPGVRSLDSAGRKLFKVGRRESAREGCDGEFAYDRRPEAYERIAEINYRRREVHRGWKVRRALPNTAPLQLRAAAGSSRERKYRRRL